MITPQTVVRAATILLDMNESAYVDNSWSSVQAQKAQVSDLLQDYLALVPLVVTSRSLPAQMQMLERTLKPLLRHTHLLATYLTPVSQQALADLIE